MRLDPGRRAPGHRRAVAPGDGARERACGGGWRRTRARAGEAAGDDAGGGGVLGGEAEAEGAGAALGARRRRVAPGGAEARPATSLHPIKKLV